LKVEHLRTEDFAYFWTCQKSRAFISA